MPVKYGKLSYNIEIYGEIVPFQASWVVDMGYCNLSHVQNQLKEAEGKDVIININSFGGDVDEGFAIYTELRKYAKDNNAKITTRAVGRCASIATVIFLAGDKRILTEYVEPFVHNAWTYTMGDAKQIQKVAADLEKCNEKIANHYATHTNLTYEEARELMDGETSITTDEAMAMRFATEIEEVLRPVALQRFTNNSNNKSKSMSKNKESLLAKIKNILKAVEDEGVQNKIVFTADQKEVDFYELADDDVVEVGAKATIDGQPADGEYVMADGNTYKFEAGTLVEIEEPEAADDATAKIAELEAEIEALKSASAEKDTEILNLKASLNKANKAIEQIKALESEFKVEKQEPTKKEEEKNSVSEAVKAFKLNKLKSK